MTMPSRAAAGLFCAALLAAAPAAAQTIDFGNLFGGVKKLVQGASGKEVSADEEARMGDEAAAVLLGTAPPHPSKALQQYVNDVGHWIAARSERPDINWRFGVLDTRSVNAFAAPGGYVFVTSGLLARLDNEAELAGVLAHEIAHVVKRHHIAAMRKKNLSQGSAALLAEIANSKGREDVKMTANLASSVYTSGLDKDDEYAADRIGMILATRAGYDPFGLPRVLQMYAAGAGGEGFELLFATHPTPEERLDELDRKIGTRLDAYEADSVRSTPRFDQVMRSALDRR